MIFNSLIFVVFFVVVLILHAIPIPWWAKKVNLLIASYIFYAAWNPPFVILLWLSTVAGMFGRNAHVGPVLAAVYVLTTTVIIGGLLLAHSSMRNQTLEAAITRAHPAALTALWTIMAFAVVIQHGESNGFIYFQF